MRKLLLLVGAIVFVDTLFSAALTPLLPVFADRLGLSKTEAGVLASAYAAGAFVGAIPGGLTAARLGVKPTVLAGLAGMSVTTAIFGFADTLWLLDAARLLQGAASAFTWTAALAWLVAAAPPDRRGELIGAAMAAAIGGALLGPVLGGTASVVGIGPAFASVAVLGGALAVWAWRTPAYAPGPPQPLSALAASLRAPGILAGAWFVLLPGLLFGVLTVLAPLRLAELGFGAVAIGAVFLTAAAAEGALAPAYGRLSDRRGRMLPLRAGLVASAIVTVVLPLAPGEWILAALVVGAAMSFGTFWAPGMSLLADAAEERGLAHAYAFALVTLAWAPGAAGGAAFAGAVGEAAGDAVPYLVLAGACVVTFWLVRPRAGGLLSGATPTRGRPGPP